MRKVEHSRVGFITANSLGHPNGERSSRSQIDRVIVTRVAQVNASNLYCRWWKIL